MKKVVMFLAIAGLGVNGDCFGMDPDSVSKVDSPANTVGCWQVIRSTVRKPVAKKVLFATVLAGAVAVDRYLISKGKIQQGVVPHLFNKAKETLSGMFTKKGNTFEDVISPVSSVKNNGSGLQSAISMLKKHVIWVPVFVGAVAVDHYLISTGRLNPGAFYYIFGQKS